MHCATGDVVKFFISDESTIVPSLHYVSDVTSYEYLHK